MANNTTRGMKLHFPWADVSKALDEVRSATGIRPLYGTDTGPGLWLVGDQGVYLMPNTTGTKRTIVYARECDPTKLDFETWRANMRRAEEHAVFLGHLERDSDGTLTITDEGEKHFW